MSEVILVVLQHSDTAANLLLAGGRVAELAGGGHLSVLSVTPSLEAAYQDWLASRPQGAGYARWDAVFANPTSAVEERGVRADLVVVARPSENDNREVRPVFRTALLKTGRPVLVVPPGKLPNSDFGRRVAIVWRPDEHTAKTLLPALRYIVGAERVFVITGSPKNGVVPAIPDILVERRVPAELHLVADGSGAFGKALLDKAHELQADLLVMGAYAHSALHNLVYGGVTRFMLQHSDLPLLMRH